MQRRRFLHLVAGSAVTLAADTAHAGRPTKAIAFDGFVIFDPRSIGALAESLFPGKGIELSNAWRLRQFEYCWLRNSMGRYIDFWTITGEALVFAARLLKLELTRQNQERLMNAYLELKAYPDVEPALQSLKEAGIRLGFLSNLTEGMLQANIKSARLEGRFEQLLSTDRVQAYKPDPRAYQMGMHAFKLSREEIVFTAFGGWDAAGAKSFGYRTYWANRLNLPTEQLDFEPDATGGGTADLVKFVT